MANWLDDYLKAWNDHDHDRIMSFMTDDVVYEDVALDVRHVGKDETSKFVAEVLKQMPDLSFKPESTHSTETHYFAEWVMEPLGVRGVSVGTLREGKISSDRDYWNAAVLAQTEERSGGD